MMRDRKKYFYKKVKRLSTTLNLSLNGRWVGTTTAFWETEFNRLQFRSVLGQVRNSRTIIPDVRQITYRGGSQEQLRALISRHIRQGNY